MTILIIKDPNKPKKIPTSGIFLMLGYNVLGGKYFIQTNEIQSNVLKVEIKIRDMSYF